MLRHGGRYGEHGTSRVGKGCERAVKNTVLLIQLILGIVLMVCVLLQTKGSGFTGSFSGDQSSVYRTRRGVERSLFRFTIGLAILFCVVALVASLLK
jgi:preprotein translocase subunit SecG